MFKATVEGLAIYPVKGFKGIAIEQAELTHLGIKNDRQWMIVNPKYQFVTQRQFPQMALMETQLEDDRLILSWNGDQFEIPMLYQGDSSHIQEAVVWKNQCKVLDEGNAVSEWLTQHLKTPWPVRLVRMHPEFTRWVDQSDKLMKPGAQVSTAFADGFPFLVANQASLDALNQQLGKSLRMNRFRPNIVVSGIPAFSEHRLTWLESDKIKIHLQYPCERCVVTTIEQETAFKDPSMQPLKVLTEINPMPNKAAAAFGQNASLSQGVGEILAVGDSVYFTE
ncbi:MOSC domain-containing protein [Pleionea litopenaei]|uniref:MOSC N-terminal beta barrel domain-containing protein n=1 Tax=Pleionea litopenaei TaxID=3070815 RepID=A0AA51RQ38_9GAMM|nr:MOSC N-terminal beta barrel domain-containing protein [Pleionea sp. HL-JVS1]WMS85533.1 MOSC N-terminal beta barrel domain-containing protein [Pleionea sp. HL-JVS1]